MAVRAVGWRHLCSLTYGHATKGAICVVLANGTLTELGSHGELRYAIRRRFLALRFVTRYEFYCFDARSQDFALITRVDAVGHVPVTICEGVSPRQSPRANAVRDRSMFELTVCVYGRGQVLIFNDDLRRVNNGDIAFCFFAVFVCRGYFFSRFQVFDFNFVYQGHRISKTRSLLSLIIFLIFLLRDSGQLQDGNRRSYSRGGRCKDVGGDVRIAISIRSLFLINDDLIFRFFRVKDKDYACEAGVQDFVSFISVSACFAFVFYRAPSCFV